MLTTGTDIAHAATRIASGKLVAMPTETVYGLAGNALDGATIKRIYAAKGRPSHNPLIVHIYNIEQAKAYTQWNEYAERLSAIYWPGPLTMVLKRKANCPISPLASAGLDTLAIRMPAHPTARELLAACDLPLVAPSANLSGTVTATNAQHVMDDFTSQDIYVLEAGATEIGLESTVIKLAGEPTLLRPGSISKADLESALGTSVQQQTHNDEAPDAPGMLTSHYAPKAALRLNATSIEEGEALLAFGQPIAHAGTTINVSEKGDLAEASNGLFAALRKLDKMGVQTIAVMPIPNEGIGIAINDRLRRAAV